MPELPDVEKFRSYIDSTVLHNKITGFDIFDTRVLQNSSKSTLACRLKSSSLSGTSRCGKYLFIYLSGAASRQST
ncbi:MAG: hypothetical protein K9L66_06230 [Spirochaetaceae bacterium]|nr:hypothetical protein [Spirochaetaceae bacterium]MCF7938865.1 hypothetical protein [Spirochaetales bacterium]